MPPPSTEREREGEGEGECGVEWRAQKKEMEKRGEVRETSVGTMKCVRSVSESVVVEGFRSDGEAERGERAMMMTTLHGGWNP